MMLPQLMKVTISPSENVSASAPSTKTRGPYQTSFIPTSAFWTNTCNVKKKNARFPQIVSYSCNYKRESKKETDNLWVFCYFLHPLCSSRDRHRNHIRAGQRCVPGSYWIDDLFTYTDKKGTGQLSTTKTGQYLYDMLKMGGQEKKNIMHVLFCLFTLLPVQKANPDYKKDETGWRNK